MVGKTSQRTQSGVGPRRGAGLIDLPAPKRAVIPSGGSGVGGAGEATVRSGQKERAERAERPASERPRAPGARSTATASDVSTQSTAGSRGRWDLPVPLGPKPRARREQIPGAPKVPTGEVHPRHPAGHPGPLVPAPVFIAGAATAAAPPGVAPDLSALEDTADMPQSLLDLELPTEALLPPGTPGMTSSPPTSSGPAWAAVLPVEPLAPASPVITRPGPSASPVPRALRGARTPQPSPVPMPVPVPVPRTASEPAALPPPPVAPPSAPALAPAFAAQDEVSRKIVVEPAQPAAPPPAEPPRSREEKAEAVAPPAEPVPPKTTLEAVAPASKPALPAVAKPVSKPSLPPPDSASAETIDEQAREAERNAQSSSGNALVPTAQPSDESQRSEASVPSSDTAQQRAALASSMVRLRGVMIVLAILAALLLGLIARTAGLWPSALTR